jgi:hypothetical protein
MPAAPTRVDPTEPPCPTCGARAARELRTADRVLRRCLRCSSIHDGGPMVRRVVPMPSNLTVHEDAAASPGYREAAAPRGLVIVRRWYNLGAWFLLVFAAIWLGILSRWYLNGPATLTTYLFPLAHLAAGLGILYVAIAGFTNRTTIAVRGEQLSVRHGPLPWWGNKDVAVGDLAQLYTEEQVTESKGGPTRTYHLGAVLRDGGRVRLVANLEQPEQALWLEQRLEEHLGIADVPVLGEYAGAREVPRLRIGEDAPPEEATEEPEEVAPSRREVGRSR